MSEKKVLVLTVHYRSADDCIQCMQSVAQSDYGNWMHVVIDNASPDDSAAVLGSYFQERGQTVKSTEEPEDFFPAFSPGRFLLYLHRKNNGFAAGNNEVLRRILPMDCYVWLLNPDVRVAPDAMRKFAERMAADSRQVLGCSIYTWKHPEKYLHAGGYSIQWLTGSVKPVTSSSTSPDYIYGASLFTCMQAFRETGLLPEDYFLYWEEAHWCLSARRKGYRLSLLPDAKVYDKVGGSTGRGFLAFYYYTRNGLRFLSWFRPALLPWVFCLNFGRMLVKLLKGNVAGARGILKGNLEIFNRDFAKGGRLEKQA